MTISEETLMAFADGELDDAARTAVEVAMREDPELQGRVARHRALRKRVSAAFADELAEPVSEQLLAVIRNHRPAASSNVVELKDVRAASARSAQGPRRTTSWWPLGSIAAGVLLGLGIGYGMWRQNDVPIVREVAGELVANGRLAAALSSQLTAEQTNASAVHIGVSYLAKSGEYCRTFVVRGTPAAPTAVASGIACMDQLQWQIQALTRDAAPSGGEYRTAATSVSPVILKVIEEQIQGEPLDAGGESAARQRAWQFPK